MNARMDEVKGSIKRNADDSILFALLIGSEAKNEAGPLSDVDIAVYLDPSLSEQENLRIVLSLGTALEMDLKREDIDIVVLNESSPALKFSAVQSGIPLLVRDEGEYEDFIIRTLSEYYDNRYFLDRQFRDATISIKGGDSSERF